jgi:hypothetical protein
MTGPADTTKFPPPEPERVERALRAMRARRAKVRRLRITAVSGAVVVAAAVAILAVGVSSTGGHRLNVTESSTTTSAPVSTTTAPTPTSPSPSTSTSTSPTTAGVGTQQITYQPFTADGAIDPALHVTAQLSGACLSDQLDRSYRCFDAGAAAGVYDPCFAGPHGTTAPLVCPGNPATGDVVAFTATSVTGPPLTTARPWAMQLASGRVCVFVSAAWGGLGPYDCQFGDSSVTPADCRTPQSAQPWWTTECQTEKTDAGPFTSERVTEAWF